MERLHPQQAIGERLRASRESRSLSQDDLAAKTGMTKAAIYEIEAGKRAPLTWTIALLARALGCPAGWLAFGGLRECPAEWQFGNGWLCGLRGSSARQLRPRQPRSARGCWLAVQSPTPQPSSRLPHRPPGARSQGTRLRLPCRANIHPGGAGCGLRGLGYDRISNRRGPSLISLLAENSP